VLDKFYQVVYTWSMPAQEIIKRVTLKEVASLANVSVSAASTVLAGLNNSVRIPRQTQERIRSAAVTLGYRQKQDRVDDDSPERTTRTARKLLHIGIIAEYDTNLSAPSGALNPWDHDISTALELALGRGNGARASFFNRRRVSAPPVPVAEAIRRLVETGVDGIVLVNLDQVFVVAKYVLDLEATGLPFVIVSSGPLTAPVANVCYDNRAAGYAAAAHLIEQGHREITFLATVSADWVEARIAGAAEAVRVHGLPASAFSVYPASRKEMTPSEEWVEPYIHTPDAVDASKAALREGLFASGVIALNDEVALGFMRANRDSGSGSGKFAVVGFDDMPEARFQGLTTLRAPREAMGREAAMLITQVCENQRARKQICLQSELVIRNSTVEYA
jgi:LacI family transcriptional regulator